MRACSFVCLVFCVLLIIDQFYRGFDLVELAMGGLVAVAFWTDNSRWLVRWYHKTLQSGSDSKDREKVRH